MKNPMEARIFYINRRGVQARALIDLRQPRLRVRVLAGSQAVSDARVTPSLNIGSRHLRSILAAQEMLLDRGDYREFAMDFTFRSPSSSAGVILGMKVNGRDCWRDQQQRSLNELLEESRA